MLDFLPIKRFQPDEPIHIELAELSRNAHKLTARGKDTSDIETKIDLLVGPLLGVAKKDARLIAKTFEK